MQIDYTYFQSGLIAIPNLRTSGLVQNLIIDDLNDYITIYEPKYLKRLMGDDLYDAFVAGIAETTPETRWTDLQSQIRDTSNKLSPIADYVWYYYQQEHQQTATQSGDKQTDQPGLVARVNSDRLCNVWNNMVEKSLEVYEWIEDNQADYPEWEYDSFDFQDINSFDL